MALDVGLTGRSLLAALVVLLTLFFWVFAPSLIAVAVIFVLLALLAYAVWIAGVRVNRRLTGRRRQVVKEIRDGDG